MYPAQHLHWHQTFQTMDSTRGRVNVPLFCFLVNFLFFCPPVLTKLATRQFFAYVIHYCIHWRLSPTTKRCSPFLFISRLPLFSLFSLPLSHLLPAAKRPPWNLKPAGRCGERCVLNQCSLGQRPSRYKFWCILRVKEFIWWISFIKQNVTCRF